MIKKFHGRNQVLDLVALRNLNMYSLSKCSLPVALRQPLFVQLFEVFLETTTYFMQHNLMQTSHCSCQHSWYNSQQNTMH